MSARAPRFITLDGKRYRWPKEPALEALAAE
jgi:hypothetical protein